MTATAFPTREDTDLHERPQLSPHDEVFGGEKLASLTEKQRNFVIQYIAGPDGIRGIAYQAYFAAGYTAKNLNTASAAVSQLIRTPAIEDAVHEVREFMEKQARARLKSWIPLAVKAQSLLEKALDQQIQLKPGDVAAINMALDRAHGKPTQVQEHEVGNKLDKLIRDLAGKSRSSQGLPEASPAQMIGPGVELSTLPAGRNGDA